MRTKQAPAEVLTLAEAAAFLKVSERTLWGLARDGSIPCHRVGNQYRFSVSSLRRLLEQPQASDHEEIGV